MDTGTAPKKTGKASPFGIPRRTIVIALTVVQFRYVESKVRYQ